MKDKSDLQRMATAQAGALELGRARLEKFDRAIQIADVEVSAISDACGAADYVGYLGHSVGSDVVTTTSFFPAGP